MRAIQKCKRFLEKLSFRTGVILLLLCAVCYVLSFAQMALPFSVAAKGVLWFILFGTAKTLQYSGLTIIGAEGLRRFRQRLRLRRS